MISKTSATAKERPTSPNFNVAALELQMWRIVLIVRTHDRSRGLRLCRTESQRKMLDLRLYELTIIFLRYHLPDHRYFLVYSGKCRQV